MGKYSSFSHKRRRLRVGFSTGTAMTAAAIAALRHLLTWHPTAVVAVRLPDHCFIPIRIHRSYLAAEGVLASVIKDGGDDPDVTHKAEISVKLRIFRLPPSLPGAFQRNQNEETDRTTRFYLIGGEGVGRVTKPGLPVAIGEPAINPIPRQMLCQNLEEELLRSDWRKVSTVLASEIGSSYWEEPAKPFIAFTLAGLPKEFSRLVLELKVLVKDGEQLAAKTLNSRLGILGGISILGTTGLVKPFSNQAYEETIQSALSVASSNECQEVVLSTGGKSERFAQMICPHLPPEAFVQIADFYAFSLVEAQKLGIVRVVHSLFFGKLVKMAQGHHYTHAHKTSLDLNLVSRLAEEKGYDELFCRQLAEANTARHALELLRARNALDVIESTAAAALQSSLRITANQMKVRILLFDYDGTLLLDICS